MEPQLQNESRKFGKPWMDLSLTLSLVLVFVCIGFIDISQLIQGKFHNDSSWQLYGIGNIFIALAVLTVLLARLLRPFYKQWPLIRVSSHEIRLPDAQWRHVPVFDISGIALAREVSIRGSKKGMWYPIFWRSDGSHVTLHSFGFMTSRSDPSATKQAEIVLDIYRLIKSAQGPQGLLMSVATQSHDHLSEFDKIERVWDPSAVA